MPRLPVPVGTVHVLAFFLHHHHHLDLDLDAYGRIPQCANLPTKNPSPGLAYQFSSSRQLNFQTKAYEISFARSSVASS